MNCFNVLDPHVNIHKNTLLEASAGTGKTFSIENIVVRLLLEKNPKKARPLKLNAILIVTFTRAATADLKFRIRKNIERCLKILKNHSLENPYTGPYRFLNHFIDQGVDGIKYASNCLEDALFCFDQSQIFTIHGFCSQMLREHIFEGNLSVDTASQENLPSSEIQKIIRNFFKTELTPEKYSQVQLERALQSQMGLYENLEKTLLKLIHRGTPIKKTLNFTELYQCFVEQMHRLKNDYNLSYECLLKDFELQKNSYKKLIGKKNQEEKILFFFRLFNQNAWTQEDFEALIDDGLLIHEFLHPENAKKGKKSVNGTLVFDHLWEILDTTLSPLINQARSPEMIIANMAHDCFSYFQNYCHQEEKLCFDHFLSLMHEAIQCKDFKCAIQKKYQVAMIDEFQDTDPLQWKIFDSLFLEEQEKGHYLYLVGDPKQSIYSFRQADIYTYLAAAEAIGEENISCLETNFRSESKLIAALNALFSEHTCGDFMTLPRHNQAIPYRPVKVGHAEQGVAFNDALGSMHLLVVPYKAKRKNAYPLEELEKDFFFPCMVKEIQHLHQETQLDYQQIAVLVSDHYQAQRLDCFFKERDIPCVLQKANSLAESDALQSIKELLKAFLNPRDDNLLKIGLGSRILKYSHQEIKHLDDHHILESILIQAYALRELLINQGFSAFYDGLMHSLWPNKEGTVKENLLRDQSGIEFYEDLQQIAELLMECQAQSHTSADGLITFLNEFKTLQINEDPRTRKRYDPQKNAVIVTTMHSSKGLEYDVVFALGAIKRSPEPDLIIPVNENNQMVLKAVLKCSDPEYLAFCEETDAEKMRQLYVAATRAKYRLYLPIVVIENSIAKQGSASPMDIFLEKMSIQASIEDKMQILQNFEEHNPHVTLQILESHSEMPVCLPQKHVPQLVFPKKVTIPGKNLCIQSFSSLSRSSSPLIKEISEIHPPNNFLEVKKTIHTLPVGSETGKLLHLILETLPFDCSDPFLYVEKYAAHTQYAEWTKCLTEIVENVLNMQIDGFAISQIHASKIYREIDFIYPVDAAIPKIEDIEIYPGYLKGVIDLVFEHGGKYYIVDWKSNWLGDSPNDYNHVAMQRAMYEHHYDLQAFLYKEALRRYLKIVHTEDFNDLYGGTYYCFLRGIDPQSSRTNGIFCIEHDKDTA